MQERLGSSVVGVRGAPKGSVLTRLALHIAFYLFYLFSVWDLAKSVVSEAIRNVTAARSRAKDASRRPLLHTIIEGTRAWLSHWRTLLVGRFRWPRSPARVFVSRVTSAVLARVRAMNERLLAAPTAIVDKVANIGRTVDRTLVRAHRSLKWRALDKTIAFARARATSPRLLGELCSWMYDSQREPYMMAATIGVALQIPDVGRARSLAEDLLRFYPNNLSDHQQAAIQFFLAGNYDDAERIWSITEERREKAIRKARLHLRNTRLLGPSWLLAIGHTAHIDIYLKRKILTGRAIERTILVRPWHMKTPNQALLNMWRHYIEIPEPNEPIGLDMGAVELLQDEFWSMRFGPNSVRMFSHAGAIVQEEWERRGLPPLLSLNKEQEERGWRVLSKAGMPKDAWFVCLHVREPGFHKGWHKSHPGTRNADIMTYLKAIRSIVERGGWVVRMGDSSMKPMPQMERVIDYAHSSLKSEDMDMFLCAKARLFIGTNSGLALVPPIFGVPCALTNWSPIALPQWYTRDRFIPKLLYSRELKRVLKFEEMFATPAGWQQFEQYFEGAGLDIIDNSPEEIDDLVTEMLDIGEGPYSESCPDRALVDEYTTLARSHGSYLGSEIGRHFLHSHSDLISLTTEPMPQSALQRLSEKPKGSSQIEVATPSIFDIESAATELHVNTVGNVDSTRFVRKGGSRVRSSRIA